MEYIQTDICVRFLKLTRARRRIYLCADDTHGTPIEINARRAGITPEALIAHYYEEHQRDFADFHIAFDCYYTTNSPENRKHAEYIFERLREKGHIVTRPVAQYYCEKDGRFLPDRYIRGTCPNPRCQAADQYGDVCEVCGTTYNPTDLRDPRCALCGSTPVIRESVHYFFTLSAYEDFLRQWVNTPGRLQPEVRRFIETWLDEGLRDWDVSRDGPYFGFKIPGEENKYFYVWLDAPVGYIATTEKFCRDTGRDFDAYWHNPEAHIYHIIGKDIVYFHTLFWPAMLHGAGYTLPRKVLVHGFLTVNGEKMSKTRGTFITARTYLNHLDPQYLRYYFAAKLNGQPDDLDLSLDDFVNRVNAELINKIANLVSRVVPFVTRHFDGRLGRLRPEVQPLVADIRARIPRIYEAYERLEFSRAVQEIVAIAEIGNKYFQEAAPWDLVGRDREAAQAACTFVANCCRAVAALLKPVLPRYAADVEAILRVPPLQWEDASRFDLEDHPIGPFRRLLERVDAKRVEAMLAASAADLEAAPRPLAAVEPFAPEISLEDFARVDLRVATVVAAEAVAGADKLLRLRVDLGREQRTIFAGIRPSYAPEELVGKQVIVVANLAPRRMRFGVSEGMLLAAGPDSRDVVVAEFTRPRRPGERVR
ncbi:MAG: methionine--tRNA ligase [Candidatus Tectimicrobiota bacterium]|nr:MAG: methionine--tRNA ligase [Candidatus Tectomicrobia bacterium]